MSEDPSTGADPKKIEELQKELDRLNREKAATEAKMKMKLEAQRLAAQESEQKLKEKHARSKSRRRKVIGGIVLLFVLVLVVLVASASVSVQPGTTANYPYITTYSVWFPIGEPVDISGHKLIALSDGNEMMFSSDGSVTKLVRNEPIVIGEQAATLTTLFGNVKVMTINYKVILEYQGNTAENQAYFKMLIQSDKSIPEFVVNFMLPKNVIAQPA